VTASSLEPVKDTLRYLVKETQVWTEITTLIIPGYNDSDRELDELSAWVAKELGPEVPLHFSAFHPDYRMLDVPATPPETLRRARRFALANGLKHVYVGNVHDREGDTTSCSACGARLIVRDWYQLIEYRLRPDGTCPDCGHALAGRFDARPGEFGRRRLSVHLSPA
jgi:pyruvate formate lyase activating enzyme